MSFAARWGVPVRIITALAVAVLLLMAFAAHSLFAAGIAFALILLTWAYAPKGYAVSDRTLIVKRPIGDIRIPLEDIRELRPASRNDLSGCIRLWASGGVFGYYGIFRTRGLGKCTWYVTDRHKCVVVVTQTKALVLSPEDVEGFLAAIRSSVAVPEPESVEPMFGLVESSRRFGTAGIVIGAVALVFAAAAMFYSPGAPTYTLTADSLAIHDRFYPVTLSASSIDLTGVRVVDIDANSPWRPTMRTNGFGNLRYHAGWFRVANGQTVRMYRAASRRLVLLPPKGAGNAVLYEVKDPDAFFQQLRRRWAPFIAAS